MTSDDLALAGIRVGDPLPSDGDVENRTYQLDFELGDLTLTEHSSISPEARLATQLVKRVEALQERRRMRVAVLAQERLEAARKARELESTPEIYAATPEAEGRGEDRRNELLREIKTLRALRDAEYQTDRLMEFRILQDWEHIVALREKAGLATTGLTLLIESVRKHKSKVSTGVRALHFLTWNRFYSTPTLGMAAGQAVFGNPDPK